MDWGLGAGRAGSPCPSRCPHCPARVPSLSLGPSSATLCPLFWRTWRLLPRSSGSCQAGIAGSAEAPSAASHPTGPDFPALPRCGVCSTPGHSSSAPARCARLWVPDILPVFPHSDASSPVPGKPGCFSSSSPSTWSSGDLAPLRRLVSHRCSSLVSAAANRILGLSCSGPQGRVSALPCVPQLLKEPRVVFPLPLMVCVLSFPGKDGEVLSLCRMPEHLVQLKSKVGLRGLGCPWGSRGVCAGLWGSLGYPSILWCSQGPEHIYCSCVSPCGTWIGYSTASRFHLYRVRCDGDGVSLRKVPKVPKLLPPAYQLQFSANSDSLFVASARGSVHVFQLLEPGGCKHLHTLQPPSGVGWGELGWCWGFLGPTSPSPVGAEGRCPPEGCVGLSWGWLCLHGLAGDNQGGMWGWVSWRFGAPSTPLSPRVSAGCSEAVYLLAPSADGHWLAAVSGDWAIHIYNLKCFKHHCMVPAYNCAVSALAIHPSTNNLVIAYSDQQLLEFSIPEKQYTSWSRAVQSRGLHRAWLERDSPITHITFNPKNPAHILLHDTYLLCVLDKSLPLPDDSTLLMNQSTLKQLPETARKRQLHAFKICKKFQVGDGVGEVLGLWRGSLNKGGNGFPLPEGRDGWDSGIELFPGRVLRLWHRVPREAVAVPSLEMSRFERTWSKQG
uniref:UTP4 small subunit processome component n=1 Tax=Ficedula albicollis TaxID=59894 RepID=A0A803V802_FICAL